MSRASFIIVVAGLVAFPSGSSADLSIQTSGGSTIGNIASSWLTAGFNEGGASSGTATRWELDGSILVDFDRTSLGSVSLAGGPASVAVFSGATQVGTLTISAFDLVAGVDSSVPVGVISMTVVGLGVDPIFDSLVQLKEMTYGRWCKPTWKGAP